jgi:hypothetical protein
LKTINATEPRPLSIHTEEANKAEINENGTSAEAGACPHKYDDEYDRDNQIDLKSQRCDGTPHITRLQLRLLGIGTQYHRDNTANGNHDTPEVTLTEAFVKHERGDEAVGDEGDDAQR